MPGDHSDGGDGLPAPLLDVVADPGRGRHRLPYLLGLLDGDAPRERLTASVALCLVVDEHPEMLASVVRRLADRLDDDAPIEVGHALDYLAARNPNDVDEAVAGLDEDAELRARERLFRSGGGFARSEYLLPTSGGHPIGRRRVAGGAEETDPRRVRTAEPEDPTDPPAADGESGASGGNGAGDDGAAGDGGGDREGGEDATVDDRDVTSGTLTLVSRRLSAVVDRSGFDDLDVLSERRRGRYGDAYRAVGARDDEETAVALTVFRLPADGERSFLSRYRAAMERWDAVGDHDRILTVHDWGIRPRPWAALEHTERSLADPEPDLTAGSAATTPADPDPDGGGPGGNAGPSRLPLDEAVATAVDLADAVAYAHQHGVVHGALDPENVRFPGTALTATERRRPLVANLGLTMAYAGRAGVGDFLDPRYAPPEYYDERVGSVDHATDVHALGLLLSRLCTGRHPYDGPLDTVRDTILDGPAPPPSSVAPDVPPAIDRIVEKATAREKLKRYETVNAFRRELRGIDTDVR